MIISIGSDEIINDKKAITSGVSNQRWEPEMSPCTSTTTQAEERGEKEKKKADRKKPNLVMSPEED